MSRQWETKYLADALGKAREFADENQLTASRYGIDVLIEWHFEAVKAMVCALDELRDFQPDHESGAMRRIRDLM